MRFEETKLSGMWVLEGESFTDERGSFERCWCQRELSGLGLPAQFVQSSLSRNHRRGTLRGLHFQAEPMGEAKIVRCIRGAVYDVVVDLRPNSPTFRQWVAQELSEGSHRALYIPAGMAHGFQTLEDKSDLLYAMTEFYQPELARGVRWNDPAFSVFWPLPVTAMADRDRSFADFE